ncbi:MAG: DUF3365 domain-containing protein [Halieaceae bacterium]|nr:DUF3365 domain-containing protein [Halieaceae bacterium]
MPRLTLANAVLTITVLSFTTLQVSADQNNAQTELTQQAKQLVAQFAGQLKPQLKQALQSGGAAHAVSVCAETAPAIAKNLSVESGWIIRRASDKNRNPEAQADTWEQARIDAFKAAVLADDTQGLEYSEQTTEGFRYAKAQLTEGLCLTCHGKELTDSTSQALNKFYPEDRAQGYGLGDVRGIFSLTKPLNDE